MNTAKKSKDAYTKISVHDDGTFVRTALVANGGDTGSIDLVDAKGVRLAQVNISLLRGHAEDGGECLIVDVIDVDRRYSRRGYSGRYSSPPKHSQFASHSRRKEIRRPCTSRAQER